MLVVQVIGVFMQLQYTLHYVAWNPYKGDWDWESVEIEEKFQNPPRNSGTAACEIR